MNEFSLYNEQLGSLILRMGLNLFILTILVRFIYYTKTRRRDFLFTFFMVGMIAFFLCISLKQLEIDTGMGLSLFAIFGIIRYRTDPIGIKEMTYLFITIGVSVFNSLASSAISWMELLTINGAVIGLTALFERISLTQTELSKVITYERIELILPDMEDEMMKDLKTRTGLDIIRYEVGKIDFLQDTAQVVIYYNP